MVTRIEDEMTKTDPIQHPPSALPDASRDVIDDFRRWGYLHAQLDPLGQYLPPEVIAELEVKSPVADRARRLYCGTTGIEFMHIADRAMRRWIEERFERDDPAPDRRRILDLLVRADVFEQIIQARYPGTKRFSLEGVTALIPFLDTLLDSAVDRGMNQASSP